MTFVDNGLIHGIEFGSGGITAWQQAKNLYCLDLWEPEGKLSADPTKLGPSNPIDSPIAALAPEFESSGSETDTDRLDRKISDEAVELWDGLTQLITIKNLSGNIVAELEASR